MLQQTTVNVVKPYYELFISKWPTITDIATAKDEEIMEAWAGLGYYRRARNLIKCAKIVVRDYKGLFPKDEHLLLKLPGVGTYTSAAIRSIGFKKKATVIDGNVARIISRLYVMTEPIALSSKEIKSHADSLVPSKRFGDYTQALMDLGSQICTPRNPKCSNCPINKDCKAFASGLSNKIPYPVQKKAKQVRYGYAFVTLTKNNNIILERRPEDGLLGGMLCFPSSEWRNSQELNFDPPFEADWHVLNESITHVFSHFKLQLKIVHSRINLAPSGYLVMPVKNFNRTALPSLMRKIFDIGVVQSLEDLS
jgi:A/G-specific adenine glycosylase